MIGPRTPLSCTVLLVHERGGHRPCGGWPNPGAVRPATHLTRAELPWVRGACAFGVTTLGARRWWVSAVSRRLRLARPSIQPAAPRPRQRRQSRRRRDRGPPPARQPANQTFFGPKRRAIVRSVRATPAPVRQGCQRTVPASQPLRAYATAARCVWLAKSTARHRYHVTGRRPGRLRAGPGSGARAARASRTADDGCLPVAPSRAGQLRRSRPAPDGTEPLSRQPRNRPKTESTSCCGRQPAHLPRRLARSALHASGRLPGAPGLIDRSSRAGPTSRRASRAATVALPAIGDTDARRQPAATPTRGVRP